MRIMNRGKDMKKKIIKASFTVGILSSFLIIQGCKQRLLSNTHQNSNSENKEIVRFVEEYRSAVEGRSIDAIMTFIAKDYKDVNNSLNYQDLRKQLEETLPPIINLRLAVSILNIGKLDKDSYEVVLLYNKNFSTGLPPGEKKYGSKKINRMIVRQRQENGSYKFEIIQGA